jgi:hypothetical protein
MDNTSYHKRYKGWTIESLEYSGAWVLRDPKGRITGHSFHTLADAIAWIDR